MAAIGQVGTTALQILTLREQPAVRPAEQGSVSDNLIAASNGLQISNGAVAPADKSKLANSIFDASTQDVTQKKLDLFRRTGEKLGVLEDDFDTFDQYSSALKDAVLRLKIDPNADRLIRMVEKEIGLDKLGVSIDTVIDAMTDPASGANKTLTAALEKQMADKHVERAGGPLRLLSDELGIYRVA